MISLKFKALIAAACVAGGFFMGAWTTNAVRKAEANRDLKAEIALLKQDLARQKRSGRAAVAVTQAMADGLARFGRALGDGLADLEVNIVQPIEAETERLVADVETIADDSACGCFRRRFDDAERVCRLEAAALGSDPDVSCVAVEPD